MNKRYTSGKLFVYMLLGILSFLSQILPILLNRYRGNGQFGSFTYRNVGRYGQKEVDSIKSSVLCFNKDKIYFTNLKFIDTCFYSELQPKAFFDREDKDVSYFQDGPLSVKYSMEKLSKFFWFNLNCRKNGFGSFYFNGDDLILKSLLGLTFFFTKKTSDQSNKRQ